MLVFSIITLKSVCLSKCVTDAEEASLLEVSIVCVLDNSLTETQMKLPNNKDTQRQRSGRGGGEGIAVRMPLLTQYSFIGTTSSQQSVQTSNTHRQNYVMMLKIQRQINGHVCVI